jgi:glucokinase
MTQNFIGIEIGGTKLQVVLGDAALNILERHRFVINPEEGAPKIRHHIATALTALSKQTSFHGIGVGFGGPVDWGTGKIACSHHVSGWDSFEFAEWIQQIVRVPVAIDNDANVAALGEFAAGAGQGTNPLFYVTMGSGVGGGLIVDGKIFHGALPGESEIGHLRLDKSGRIVEDCCSGWAVDQKIRQVLASGKPSMLAQLVGTEQRAESRFLAKAVQRHDVEARRILHETADDLAFALSHVIQLMHPQKIILGGGLSLMGEILLTAVESALPKYVMRAFHPVPTIALAELGENVVPIGALELARQRLTV